MLGFLRAGLALSLAALIAAPAHAYPTYVGAHAALLDRSEEAATAPAFLASLGSAQGTLASARFTTIQTAPAGSIIVLVAMYGINRTYINVSSDGGNGNTFPIGTATSGASPINGAYRLLFIRHKLTHDIPANSSIGVDFNATGSWILAAQVFSGASAGDLTGALSADGTTAPVTASPGTPATAKGVEILVGMLEDTAATVTTTFTVDSAAGWGNVLTDTRGTLGRLFMASRPFTDGLAPAHTGAISPAAKNTNTRILTIRE